MERGFEGQQEYPTELEDGCVSYPTTVTAGGAKLDWAPAVTVEPPPRAFARLAASTGAHQGWALETGSSGLWGGSRSVRTASLPQPHPEELPCHRLWLRQGIAESLPPDTDHDPMALRRTDSKKIK